MAGFEVLFKGHFFGAVNGDEEDQEGDEDKDQQKDTQSGQIHGELKNTTKKATNGGKKCVKFKLDRARRWPFRITPSTIFANVCHNSQVSKRDLRISVQTTSGEKRFLLFKNAKMKVTFP